MCFRAMGVLQKIIRHHRVEEPGNLAIFTPSHEAGSTILVSEVSPYQPSGTVKRISNDDAKN
jgi:hypothetical protein